jgi:hypothetical protein
MSTDELRRALESLREAHERADGETEERLEYVTGRVEAAHEGDRKLDQGGLARRNRTLAELADEERGETREASETASDALTAYREGVPGV